MNEELDLDHCFETVTAIAKEAGTVSALLCYLIPLHTCTCFHSK